MADNKFARALKDPLAQGEQSSTVATSRKGRKHIGGYFAPAVSKQLRVLAAEEDTSVQELLEQAIGLLFQSRGRSTPAK